jgi:tight adherence protein B
MPIILSLLAGAACAYLTWSLAWAGPSAAPARVPSWEPWLRPLLLPLALGLVLGIVVAPWAGALAMIGGAAWPRLRGRWEQRRQLQRQSEQMPSLLEALSGGLRAGLSLPQSLEAAVEDLPQPSAGLAQRLLNGLRLGETPEDLMLAEARLFEGHALAADWRLLSTAVGIQRSSGGDLAAVLDQLTETLRERERLRAQVDALTAQGRLSAWIVGCLPLALLAALQALDPDLVAPLFHTQTGWVLLGLGALMETAGILLLRRIVDIDA